MKIKSLIRAMVLGLILVLGAACSSSVETPTVNGNGADPVIDEAKKPIDDGSINVAPPGSGHDHDADAEQEPTDPLLNL